MSEPTTFIVYALPRSRTFWLSRFLSYGDWQCGHDQIRYARTLEDLRAWLSMPAAGTVETAAAPWWRLVQKMRPDIKTVVVRRPVDQCMASLLKTGVQFDIPTLRRELHHLDAKLDQIEHRVPGAISVAFDDLADERVCQRVFEHCLPYRHDPAWWAAVAPCNLQISLPAMMRYYHANAAQLDKLAKTAKGQVLSGFARALPEPEGFTFQQEPLAVALRDGDALIREHCALVGDTPESRLTKNWPLMLRLEQLGVLQVTTARSNGRMFGYLIAIVAPSLEAADKVEALHTTFFTSKDAPGLGLKLQRASVESLRNRGVDVVTFRAGTRGLGPRMGSVYRRLGAEEAGQIYMLDLKGAA